MLRIVAPWSRSFRPAHESALRVEVAGFTPLYVAVSTIESLPLTVWLLDEKDADLDVASTGWLTPLHVARSPDIVNALLGRDPDRTMRSTHGLTPLMYQAHSGTLENVMCLLQDLKVRATVNARDHEGKTALHYACLKVRDPRVTYLIHLLLRAGAYPAFINTRGDSPVAYLRRHLPSKHPAIALFKSFPHTKKDAAKASTLFKARRFAVAAAADKVPVSFCLQERVARGQPLPHVTLVPMTGGRSKDEEKSRKFRSMVAFVVGMDGPKGEGMPRDVFRVVMDLLMPAWDPHRFKDAGTGPPLQA